MNSTIGCLQCGNPLGENGFCPICIMQLALSDVLDPDLTDRDGDRDDNPSTQPSAAIETKSTDILCDKDLTSPSENDDGRSTSTVQQLQQYKLVDFLGRGGMGTVYKAWDTQLKRHVAIKMITAGEHSHPEELRRFRREAEAVARLQHPSIVPIFEIGEDNGLPFLVLEFIPGSPLAKKLTGKPWPTRDAVELVATLADAVQVAHLAGVVHRDLKPGNILITEATDDAGSTAHITDFGLAKLTEADKTESGIFMGTPSYSSPEQAAGRAREIGPVSDIFSLGSILYELLTGKPPFRGETLVETLNLVMHNEPVPPQTENPKVPRDVQTICLKAMAKTRADRYPSAQEFADDLRRWRDGLPIRARHVGPVERGWRWCRRNPVIASLLTMTIVTLLAGTTVSVIFAVIARNRADTISTVNDDLRKANEAASKAAKKAQEQARLADEQSQLALKTLESVIFDVQTKLANLPNAQHVRADLLKTALAGLEKVSEKLRASKRMDRNTAMATLNLAEVYRQVGSNAGVSTNSQASQLYHRATNAFEALYKANPKDVTATRDLAEACFLYASHLGRSDDPGIPITPDMMEHQKKRPKLLLCLKLHQRSIKLHRQLVDANPQDDEAKYQLARALSVWASDEVRTGDLKNGLNGLNEALGLLHKLLKTDPNNVAYRTLFGSTSILIGDYYLDFVGHEQASPHYEEAMKVFKRLAAEHPNDPELQLEFADAWARKGDISRARKQYEKALEAFQKELEITQALEKIAPNNVELMWDSGISYTHVSRELIRLKRFDEAELVVGRLLKICGPIVATYPNDRRSQSLMLLARGRMAIVQYKLGQFAKAKETFRKATEDVNAYRQRTGDNGFAERIVEIQKELKLPQSK